MQHVMQAKALKHGVGKVSEKEDMFFVVAYDP
jgi:hypothetical protein